VLAPSGFFLLKLKGMDTTEVFHWNVKAYTEGKRLIINRGGTSSTKTYSILQLLILIAHKRKMLISVVGETMPFLRRGALKDFMDILQKDNLYVPELHDKTNNKFKFNEGTIEFFSCDSPDRIRGPRRDILYVNECNNISLETFEQLDIRTSRTSFLDFNPTAPFWVLDLPRGEDTVEIVSTFRMNKFLSPKIIKSIEAKKFTHPEWYNVYANGEWGELEDNIFKNWDQVEKIPDDAKLLGFGMDWGFSVDKTAVVQLSIMNGELYIKELLYENGMTNRDISKKLEEIGIVRGIDEIFADSSEPKSIKELRDGGWMIRGAAKGPDSIMRGIDLLKQHKMHVTSDSVNLIKELRQYRWQKDKFTGKSINKPVGGYDHLCDSLRYIAISKLGKKKRFLKQWN
jgi:phage terminase large subunit